MQPARRCVWPICSKFCCARHSKFSGRPTATASEISRTERIRDRLGAAIRRYLADILARADEVIE